MVRVSSTLTILLMVMTYVNIRHCQYTLYHSELNRFEHQWGPLLYLNPENDITLTTTNFFCTLDSDLNIDRIHRVDTSSFDRNPLWEFVGLEDCRIVNGMISSTFQVSEGISTILELVEWNYLN